MTDNVIIIPTRLEATRLPNKPLKKINNKEMILHVYEAAKKANIGDVIVASPNQQIYELITSAKGICVKTKSDHETGTDRIFEVFDNFLNKKPQTIINLQGDMPNIEPSAIQMLSNYMSKNLCDIATLASKFKDNNEIHNINNVKVTTNQELSKNQFDEATDFFRKNENTKKRYIYHHIGIYAFTREALLRYVSLDRTKKELDRNLEQLRALENNMKIHVGYTPSSPLSIDTEDDLKTIQESMKI
ncbi:MAG: 3-deoxy-manno-octulosonate cytidylyltransferase [Candidatus Pelagibacter sp. TMED263]|nr:MAG: 3-deoxy-manno-octulosonate cytidylyltransferase [Candidatus Pelagibacter sp. TMED263]|tara:strand:- start:484 stop:1218 length:735 start_codon:yes stop_codon:yes gene_type:complete